MHRRAGVARPSRRIPGTAPTRPRQLRARRPVASRARAHRTRRGESASTGASATIPVWCAVSARGTSSAAIASGVTVSRTAKPTAQAMTAVASSAATGSGRIAMSQANATDEEGTRERPHGGVPAWPRRRRDSADAHRQSAHVTRERDESVKPEQRARRSCARRPSGGATRASSRVEGRPRTRRSTSRSRRTPRTSAPAQRPSRRPR